MRAGRYDDAVALFRDRLAGTLYKFGAYQTRIELLRELFPDGEDKVPRLKTDEDKAWTQAALANSYGQSGQPRRAIPLYKRHNEIREGRSDKKNFAIGLTNLAVVQFLLGEFDAAESNLRRQIEIDREIKDQGYESIGHFELGRQLAYRGRLEYSKEELAIGMKGFIAAEKINLSVAKEWQGKNWAYHALNSLFMSNAEDALKYAKKARELADVEKFEKDIIRAEYLLGAAYLMKGDLIEAEQHLTEALTRDRKINLVELEPDILLEFAKLWFQQDHKPEAREKAEEALQIANRCEYRLKQADIHNFLTAFYLDVGDLTKAKEHAEIAKERAECGYKPALEKAEQLLEEIEQRST